ncbi:MAG TPA: enoyl-CoA hydratase/isomerase family protein [bacterium]|nr:enoyl-CoA hydratase/isomerase family protein [bacterium]
MVAADGHVTLTRDGRAARIVLDRPPLNVLTLEMIQELTAICDRLAEAPEIVIVTLAAAGGRAFCAGVDVAAHAPDRAEPMLAAFEAMAERLLALDPILIAAVSGAALGGGWELALLCDFVVASERAMFGVPEVKLAALPPVAAAILPLLVGHLRALEFVVTGRQISAHEAQGLGLVSRVASAENVETATRELVATLLSQSGPAIRAAKAAVVAPRRDAICRSLRAATEVYRSRLLPTQDAAEGIAAFLEKRAPAWKHV